MATDASSGSAKTDGIAASAQGEESNKQSQDPVSCFPSSCTFTENHLKPHLQQVQYGQFDESLFSHFPAAAMHMLAWQWPSNLGYAAAPCTVSNDVAPGQCNNQGNNVNSIFEYVNQLGAFYKQLPRHFEQVPQHQHRCQHPYQFMQMSELENMHAQNMTHYKDEQSKLMSLNRSEVPPHLMNRSQALYPHPVPMSYHPGTSIYQPRVVNNFSGHSSCGDSGITPPSTGLRGPSANVQSHQGDGGEENCTRESEKAQSNCLQSQCNFSPRNHYAASPTQRLFHTPNSGGPLNAQESHCMDECLQHHCPRVACSSSMPAMSCLVNVDPSDSAGHGATQWNGLQPGAGLWDQVGASSFFPPRCSHHAPVTTSNQVISTPFPLSSASSKLPDVFNSLWDSSGSTSLPSSSSPFQLSAQSAFSYMTSYDTNFLRSMQNPKGTGCQMPNTKPACAAAAQHAASLKSCQPGQCASSDDLTSRDDPNCHSSDPRISTPTPAIAGSRHEPSESYQGYSSGMNSSSAENVVSANGAFQRAAFLRRCPSYPLAKSNLPSHASSFPVHAPDIACKDPLDCRMQRQEQIRAAEFATRGPSESAGVVYSSHQGGRFGGGRGSPPEFCNLLGQDQHVLMRRNSQYAIARDPLNVQVGALALCGHQAFDFPYATAPCVPPTGIHEVHLGQVNKTSSMQRQPGVKGQWGAAEDRVLSKLVKRYGSRRWSLISTFMANRSGKQCRERWVNHLQPDIRKEGWTTEEEELLVHAHSTFGNRWSAIAKDWSQNSPVALMGEQMLPGRTDNSIKNHWHAALRKKDRGGQRRPSLLREYIQKKTAGQCDLSRKTLGSLPAPIQTGAEVKNSESYLIDSKDDKKDADQNMQVDEATTICYTKNIVEETQNEGNLINEIVNSNDSQME